MGSGGQADVLGADPGAGLAQLCREFGAIHTSIIAQRAGRGVVRLVPGPIGPAERPARSSR